MKTNTTLLTATLLAIGSSAFALTKDVSANDLVLNASATATAAPLFEDAKALVDEYTKAEEDFSKKLRAADRAERKELRKNHPVKEFWPKFEALGADNNGIALLWMADNIKTNKDIKRAERPRVLLPIYTALVEHHGEAKWFPSALESLARNAKAFEPDQVTKLVSTAVANVTEKEPRGKALYLGARTLLEIDRETADDYLAEIAEDYADQHIFTAARALTVATKDVQEGKVAPDFLGETKDGFKFNISDYRGKVVVLDFYGFW